MEFDSGSIVLIFLFIRDYFETAKTHWTLVISHMFYVDIVKVFSGTIRRRYLKSCVFGWGVSLITSISYSYARENASLQTYKLCSFMVTWGIHILPVILNCFIYIIIVFSLCRSFDSTLNSACIIWRRLYIATLIFILCDILMLYDKLINEIFVLKLCCRFFHKIIYYF